jgi:hypothetical protein
MQARWLTLYLGALLAVMPALTSSSEAAFPGRNGRIAAGGMFLAGGCGEWGAIATMEPDGTRRRSLGCRSRGQFSSVNGRTGRLTGAGFSITGMVFRRG